MKKTNKKNSTARKLLPAFAMLTVSAISLSSATYAWFTMNKTVNVTNMQVKAKAEKGLLINEVAAIDSTTWDELATSTADTNFTLIPMSTLDGVNWNHANSTKANDSGKASSATTKGTNLTSTGYEIYGLAASAGGSNLSSKKLDFINTAATAGSQAETNVYYMEKDSTAGAISDVDDGAFVKYTYYLKSSGTADITVDATTEDSDGDKVYVKTITVSGLDCITGDGADGKTLAHDLDKTLRVGINVNDGTNNHFYTFAPVDGADEEYFIATTNDTFAATADSVETGSKTKNSTTTSGKMTCSAEYNTGLAIGTLPSTVNTNGGKKVDVYLWFEGEDSNCKTDNIYSDLDELIVDIEFGLK
ncbi:MAG: hypothetical protein J6I47_05405 [Ruminococcus sp.]|nr:hypothetical protein [Ruminococcus sp.]